MKDKNWTVAPWKLIETETGITVKGADGQNIFHESDKRLPQVIADACLIAAAPRMYDSLEAAAAQMRKYEVLHRAKGTPESTEKAEVNAALAARLERDMAFARGEK